MNPVVVLSWNEVGLLGQPRSFGSGVDTFQISVL